MNNAPTTRETADHAELARIEDVAEWFESGDPGANGSVLLSASVAAEHARDLRFLLSEIAALRGEVENLYREDLKVMALSAMDDALQAMTDRATQAERQRDEAVGLLRELADGRSQKNNINEYDDLSVRASTLLANQGADQ